MASFVTLDSGWGLGLAISKETVTSEIRANIRWITVIVSIIIIVVCGIGVLFTQSIGKRWMSTEEDLWIRTHGLDERVKVLTALYTISKLFKKPGISLEDIFQGAVEIIPPSWQYSEITCSRIIQNENEYKTEIFEKTNWKQSQEIVVTNKKTGILEVYISRKNQRSLKALF